MNEPSEAPGRATWLQPRVRLGITLLAVATLAGHLESTAWFLALAAHFKLHAALAALILGVLALASRSPKTAAAAMVLLAVNAWPLLALVPEAPSVSPNPPASGQHAVPEAAKTLTIVAYNVNTANRQIDEVVAALRATQADVIAVLETNRTWSEALRRVDPAYTVLAHPRGDNFGLTVLSRVPVRGWELRHLGDALAPTIDARLDANGVPLRILAVHTVPPMDAAWTTGRDTQLAAVADLAREATAATVVLGDFNATPWCAPMLRFAQNSGLVNSMQGFGAQASWPGPLGVLGIPIDHLWHSPMLQTVDRTVGSAFGSDHRMVLVRLKVLRQ